MNNGFILLHRKLLTWQWYKDSNTLHLFVDLLLEANYEDSKVGFETIKRGQCLTSLKRINENTGLTYQQIRTSLTKLEKSGEINKQTTNRYSIITINNYDDYQDVNKQTTNKQQTNNNIKEINKNKKNKKEINNIYTLVQEFENLWSIYPKKQGKTDAEKKYQKYRKEGTTYEEVLQGLENYNSYIKRKGIEQRYIKNGSTWFNQKCWNDDYTDIETKDPQMEILRGVYNGEIKIN